MLRLIFHSLIWIWNQKFSHLRKNQLFAFLTKIFKLPLKACILLSRYPTLFLTCWSFVKKSSCRASHFLTSCSFFRLLLLSVARWDDDDKKWKGPPKVSTLNMICYKVAATWSFGQKRQSTPHFIFITSILTSIKMKHHAFHLIMKKDLTKESRIDFMSHWTFRNTYSADNSCFNRK